MILKKQTVFLRGIVVVLKKHTVFLEQFCSCVVGKSHGAPRINACKAADALGVPLYALGTMHPSARPNKHTKERNHRAPALRKFSAESRQKIGGKTVRNRIFTVGKPHKTKVFVWEKRETLRVSCVKVVQSNNYFLRLINFA